MKTCTPWIVVAAFAAGWAAWEAVQVAEAGGAATDPEKVVGVQRCADCHAAEVEVWKNTRHAKTFEEMHGSDAAKEIAGKLGERTGEKIRSIKKAATCQKCHYTVAMEDGKPEAKSGVSCESCHGASAEWVDDHQNYGIPGQQDLGAARKAEAADHRTARLDRCAAVGMIRPDMYYQLARNCFSCHSVSEEDVVESGHTPGSKDFELVAWTQGEVRHNTHWTADGEGRDLSTDHKNREASVERKRVLYVVGRLTDLEFTLRAIAQAKANGSYYERKTMRAGMLLEALGALQKACPVHQVGETLQAAGVAAPFDFEKREVLGGIADMVGKLASDFASKADGKALAGIDSLLPTEYRVHQSE